ncbi:MAG: hypothetical protein CEE43_19160 [Promethearchaeota archaeon Loki_b32]|nr:MAG: hypothetical protein CEE43_19160 [Candidatus Lokiarchaeota archaeon Loki_b32]
MGAGKIIAIIGGILGILTIGLYFVLPEIFCLWRLDGAPVLSIFLGGFGSSTGELMGVAYGPEYAEDIFLLIVGVLIVAGGALAIIGGLAGNKIIGILGGVLMIAGPIILTIALFAELGDFEDIALLLGGESLFWGSEPGVDWGLWIGFFLAIGGGVLGVIGGATS